MRTFIVMINAFIQYSGGHHLGHKKKETNRAAMFVCLLFFFWLPVEFRCHLTVSFKADRDRGSLRLGVQVRSVV